MSKQKTDPEQDEPMVRFGGEWLPAHDVWGKMETANVVTDVIERFNQHFPELASTVTHEVVPLVRQRLKEIELRMHKDPQEVKPDLSTIAGNLLDSMSPEDAIAALRETHGMNLEMVGLIQFAGDKPYRRALRREAVDFELNRISPQQTAQLWNDAARPAPGGGLWSADKVSALLKEQD